MSKVSTWLQLARSWAWIFSDAKVTEVQDMAKSISRRILAYDPLRRRSQRNVHSNCWSIGRKRRCAHHLTTNFSWGLVLCLADVNLNFHLYTEQTLNLSTTPSRPTCLNERHQLSRVRFGAVRGTWSEVVFTEPLTLARNPIPLWNILCRGSWWKKRCCYGARHVLRWLCHQFNLFKRVRRPWPSFE